MNFPYAFNEQTQSLPYDQFGPIGKGDFDLLADKGYEVRVGLTPELAAQITVLSEEKAIKEYCPKDSAERFASLEATQRWLTKGRAVFLLIKSDERNPQVVGYGWVGPGKSEHAPGGEMSFAIRIGETGQGQGLATPYLRLILAGAAVMFKARNVWLETWQSNGGAVHVYHKIGAVDVAQEILERPTADGGTVRDTRLYMTIADNLLNT